MILKRLKRSDRRVVLLLASFIGTAFLLLAGFELNVVATERVRVLSSTSAGCPLSCNGTLMTEWLCFVEVGARQAWGLLPWRWMLIRLEIGTLMASIYIVAGLGGGIIALWLHLTRQLQANAEWSLGGVPRILLAGAAGLLSYWLLLLPAGWVPGAPIQNYGTSEAIQASQFFMRMILLPAAAGLFTTVFFEQLSGILTRILESFKGATK